MQILGILAFVVALLISVMIHEFGHYVTAKHFGMKVSEFFLGFGARIWSYRRGETEFGIKAVPAGGYCRIEGMTPGDVMPPGEEGRAFYKATSGRKLVVLGAGSFLHFIIGYLLLFTLFVGIGTTQARSFRIKGLKISRYRGAVDCRKMALAAVVSLLAVTKRTSVNA